MLQEQKKLTAALLCGVLGCLCFGGGDWLMIYGDTAHNGSLPWLTAGTAHISPWRNNLAMFVMLSAYPTHEVIPYLSSKRTSTVSTENLFAE